jgi:hypothetical protein
MMPGMSLNHIDMAGHNLRFEQPVLFDALMSGWQEHAVTET